ncbi:MAG: F0F1 ATP synthase subunit beta, partial [Planctomycetota bacterium]
MVTSTASALGRITQIIGSTFDVEFAEDHMPDIYNAVTVTAKVKGIDIHVTGEVQQHLGGGRVRCIALGTTDGMVRSMEVVNTGAPLSVPVGKETLGRVFNVLGNAIDG